MNKKTLIDSIVGLILGITLMLSVIYLVPKESIDKVIPNTAAGNFIFFISIIFGPFFAIFLHELGHLLAGLAQGFKLQIFVVAFFGLKRENEKVVPFLNKEIQFFGGIAATSPLQIGRNLKNQFAIILAAGPLFSFIFGILSLILFVNTNSIFNSTLAIVGLVSIGLFIATTLPEKSGIFFTDRKRFQRLLGKGKTAEIEQGFLQSTSQILIDGHYKNLDIVNLKLMQSDVEPIVKFWGCFYEYKYHKETGDEENAFQMKIQLSSFEKIIPKTIWKSLEID